MAMMSRVLVLVMIVMDPVLCVDVCGRGEMLYTPRDGPDICLPCNGGTFMEEDWHTQRRCHDCSRIKKPFVDVIASDCNRTHNTVILCAEGYYRTPSNPPDVEGECKKCTECEHPTGKCQGYQDTICCPGESYCVSKDAEGKPVCIKECAQGEFVDLTSNECRPCPAGTYMQAEKHLSKECLACPQPVWEAEEILLPCTSTKPAVMGCKAGYYRMRDEDQHSMDECVRCRECLYHGGDNYYTGRECDRFHDTVCCPQPDMIVEDTPDGPVCKPALTVPKNLKTAQVTCGIGQYLYSDPTMEFNICLSCPPDTYMDEADHNKTQCKNCANFRDTDRHEYSSCLTKVPDNRGTELGGVNVLLTVTLTTIWICLFALVINYIILYLRRRGKNGTDFGFHSTKDCNEKGLDRYLENHGQTLRKEDLVDPEQNKLFLA